MDEPLKIQPRARERVQIIHREPIRVQPKQRDTVSAKPINTIWERSGWVRQPGSRGPIYLGAYRVIDRMTGQEREFEGRIDLLGTTTYPYVRNPPRSLHTSHPKHLCFLPQASGWWRMNWYQGTDNIDETIVYMTQLLNEALNVYR